MKRIWVEIECLDTRFHPLVAEEPQRVGKYGEGLDDVGVDASALGMIRFDVLPTL